MQASSSVINPGQASQPQSAVQSALQTTQSHEASIQACLDALKLAPEDIAAYNALGMAYQACGQFDQALEAYGQMLARRPDDVIANNNIGSVKQALGQFDSALEHYRQALIAAPYFDCAHFSNGTCLMLMGRYAEALDSFKEAVRLNPSHQSANMNLIAMQGKLGLLEEAIASCRKALRLHPEWHDIHSSLLFNLTHSTQIDVATLFSEHVKFGDQFEAPWRHTWPQHANARDPERRLRVGFVSGDLNHHAMANFIAPIFDHLIYAQGLELFIYSNNHVNDFVTTQLRGVMQNWRDIRDLNDDALVQTIQDDGIDILIDLSGHTGHNRLTAFARKPAPLQLTWIGYPLTTGLQAMDYFLTDPYFSPPGLLDDQFTEKCLRLPATAPFMPAPDAPPVSASPVTKNGYITFGSFNRPNKFSPALIARWCDLLKALPEAKLVLGAMPNEASSEQLRQHFTQQGIASERLQFYLQTNVTEYLGLHGLVDICLDTSPYGGGTTTFHALWMGVPTITMTGASLPGRVAACILGHIGLHDFITENEAEFLKRAVAIASQPAHLASLRETMRTRVSNSALGQPALIAAGFEAALRTAWRRWCNNLPAVSFDAAPEQSSLCQRAASMQALHNVNVDAALLLAIEHHQAGRLVEAETLYLAIIHQQSGHAIANHNMGLLARQLGLNQEALPYLATAHAAAPDEAQFCCSYAQGLLQTGQAALAHAVLVAGRERGLNSNDLEALLSQVQAEIAHAHAQPSQAEAAHIVDLYQAGEHAEMELASRALTARYPQSGFAWSALGTALQLQGKDALAVLQTAVQLAPDDAQAQSNLGNAYQDLGLHADAIACYQHALALEPDFAEAYCNMASAQLASGHATEAADTYRKVLTINPSHELAQHQLDILSMH